MTGLKTKNLSTDRNDISKAARILSSGGIVAFPTETVYGLGCDARDNRAVASVYAAKGRPSFNPLIVHVAEFEMAKRFAIFNDTATKIAHAFWPGPISLVVPLVQNHGLSDLITAGLDTVAIRIPKHPVAKSLLMAFDGPIAAPSANPSGRISPTLASHVTDDMDGKINAIVDGGACAVGLESTILLVSGDKVSLLRAGGVSVEIIKTCLEQAVELPSDPKKPKSPGQLQSHYAPNANVRLNASLKKQNELLLGFGSNCGNATFNLSSTGDLVEAAANLFAYLRKIDALATKLKVQTIAINPIPMTGLGLAINDRLKRAAAPKI